MELTLRKVTKDDKDFFVENLNSSLDYSKWIHTPYPYTKKDALSWINQCLKQYKEKKPTRYSYIITLDDVPVGSISFDLINHKNNNAELGYWISKKYSGKGIMQVAMKMICYIGFKQLKFKRLSANVSSPNKKSQNLLKRCGFKLEGVLKKDIKYKNKYEDSMVFAIVK